MTQNRKPDAPGTPDPASTPKSTQPPTQNPPEPQKPTPAPPFVFKITRADPKNAFDFEDVADK